MEMISLKDVYKNHSISRENILHDAIKEMIDIYYYHRGEWKLVAPFELKCSPHPDDPLHQIATGQGSKSHREQFITAILNQRRIQSKTLHVKKADLKDYLETIHDLEKKQAKTKGPMSKKLKTLEFLAGALIVANYQNTITKTGKRFKMSAIEDNLTEVLTLLDYDLSLVSKGLRKQIIPDAIKAFLELQKPKK